MRTEIWIGGCLPRCLLPGMPIDGLFVDWSQTPCVKDEVFLMEVARKNNGYLRFVDNHAADSNFNGLRQWLQGRSLPFRLFSEEPGRDPYILELRPDLPDSPERLLPASRFGEPLLSAQAVEDALQLLNAVATEKSSSKNTLANWQYAYKFLRERLPAFPPMPRFSLCGDDCRCRTSTAQSACACR